MLKYKHEKQKTGDKKMENTQKHSALDLEDVIRDLKGTACLIDAVAMGDAPGHIYIYNGLDLISKKIFDNIKILEEIDEQLSQEREKMRKNN